MAKLVNMRWGQIKKIELLSHEGVAIKDGKISDLAKFLHRF
jgi:hypothetical protein